MNITLEIFGYVTSSMLTAWLCFNAFYIKNIWYGGILLSGDKQYKVTCRYVLRRNAHTLTIDGTFEAPISNDDRWVIEERT